MTDQDVAAPDGAQATGQTGTGGHEQPKSWYDGYGFADEDVGFLQNKGWDKDPKSVVDAYKQLEKFRGADEDHLLFLPKNAEDKEAWDKVFTKLGRPENPEGYGEFKLPEGVDVALDDNRMKWADEVAHKLGLTKAQRDNLLSETVMWEAQQMGGHNEQVAAQQEAEYAALKKEWGSAHLEREELGKRAVRAFIPGDQAEREQLANKIESAIGTAAMLRMFANIGEKIGEDKMPNINNGGRPFGYTKEQAMAEKKALMEDIGSDPKRLLAYSEGKGEDYRRIANLQKIIAS